MMGAIQQMLVASGGGLWTPAYLATPPKLWLNDLSAVTDAGSGACSQWNDISGNGYHVTQSTSGERPTITAAALNGRRYIDFDGGDDLNLPSGSYGMTNNVSSVWMMAVYRHDPTDATDTNRALITIGSSASGAARSVLYAGSGATGGKNKPAAGGRRLDADSYSQYTSASERSGSALMSMGVWDYTNNAISLYIDGELDGTLSSAWGSGGNSSATNSARSRIGAGTAGTANQFIDGPIAEMIVGAGNIPTSTEINKLFGYLAYRWGLQGNLDVSHPYKSSPPTT